MLHFATSSGAALDTRKADEQKAAGPNTNEQLQTPLGKGPALGFYRKLEALNKMLPEGTKPVFRLSMVSKQNLNSGIRMMNTLHAFGLDIQGMHLSQGTPCPEMSTAFGANIYFSMNQDDVINAQKKNIPAALIVPPKHQESEDSIEKKEVVFAFDFDGVIGDDSSEYYTRTQGLDAYHEHESKSRHVPFPDGPLMPMLKELHAIRTAHPELPIRVILVTSRGASTCFRPLEKISHMFDQSTFLAGKSKGPALKQLGADIFFDDAAHHCVSAAEHGVLGAHVISGIANKHLLKPEGEKDKAATTSAPAVSNVVSFSSARPGSPKRPASEVDGIQKDTLHQPRPRRHRGSVTGGNS